MARSTTPAVRRHAGFGWKWLLLIVLVGLIAAGTYPLGRYLWINSLYQSALRAADARDFAAARRNLDVCLGEWPRNAEVRFQAARVARRAGDFEAAARLLKDAERLGWVREALDLEWALVQVQQGQYRSLAPALIGFVRRGHPDSVLILEVLAPAALANLDLDLAQECLEAWLQRDPGNAEPRLLRGDVFARLHNRNEALRMYEEAVRLAPDNAGARLRHGRMLFETKNLEGAREQFDWLMQHQGGDPEVRLGQARLLHARGQDDEARRLLDALLAERPDDAEALAARGQIELDADQAARAEPWLRRAVERDPYELALLYSWALCLERLDRPKEAQAALARMRRGEEDQRRVNELMRSVARSQHDPEPRRQIGLLLMRNGREADGRRWLESALAQDPRHVATHEDLANHYERMANHERAELHRRLAREAQKPN